MILWYMKLKAATCWIRYHCLFLICTTWSTSHRLFLSTRWHSCPYEPKTFLVYWQKTMATNEICMGFHGIHSRLGITIHKRLQVHSSLFKELKDAVKEVLDKITSGDQKFSEEFLHCSDNYAQLWNNGSEGHIQHWWVKFKVLWYSDSKVSSPDHFYLINWSFDLAEISYNYKYLLIKTWYDFQIQMCLICWVPNIQT